ncbi:MAG: hypothetical protein LPK02_07065 [Rhodobacterales bacterium]|nr:hypothetical protein [Rhodobacterales bacterium]
MSKTLTDTRREKMRKFLTIDTADREMQMEVLHDVISHPIEVRFLNVEITDDRKVAMINEIIVRDSADDLDDGEYVNMIGTIDLQKDTLSLHLLDGEHLPYRAIIDSIYATMEDYAAQM